MLPARIVLEHNDEDHSYRTFLETFDAAGTSGFKYGRYFYWEAEALADFKKRSARL